MLRSDREQARRSEVPSLDGAAEDEACGGGEGFSLEGVLASLEEVRELPESSLLLRGRVPWG